MLAGIDLNRKILAEMAVNYKDDFTKLVEAVSSKIDPELFDRECKCPLNWELQSHKLKWCIHWNHKNVQTGHLNLSRSFCSKGSKSEVAEEDLHARNRAFSSLAARRSTRIAILCIYGESS
uniref:Uncharacterized protein n=1 Tax=Onchocerca volvulus TaxID=6282 RepID=A0A8R1TN42_ONCVO